MRAVARDDVASRRGAAAHRGGVAAGQVDAHPRVAQRRRATGVQAHRVALHGGGHAATDVDATAIVARNQVAGTRCRATDGDGAAVVHVQAVARVTQVNRARDIGADLVALHGHRARGGDPHAPVAEARDHVACAGRRATDGDVAGGGLQHDPVSAVGAGEGAGAGGIGADVVATHDGAVGTAGQVDVVGRGVAGDHVAICCSRAPDQHVGAIALDAFGCVALSGSRVAAIGVEAADVIANDGVVVRARVDVDAIGREVADHEATDGAAIGRRVEREAVSAAAFAIEHDERVRAVAGLGRRVQVDGFGDGRQRRAQRDRVLAVGTR